MIPELGYFCVRRGSGSKRQSVSGGGRELGRDKDPERA